MYYTIKSSVHYFSKIVSLLHYYWSEGANINTTNVVLNSEKKIEVNSLPKLEFRVETGTFISRYYKELFPLSELNYTFL